MMLAVLYMALLVLSVLSSPSAKDGRPANSPPPTLGRPFEKFTNKTLDEIITGTMGGVDVASNMILLDDGRILAELDMYLREDQFLAMYKPPGPEEMVKMGMMPAPIGAPPATEKDYSEFTEDYRSRGDRTKRKATRDVRLRWTGAVIPYLFATGHFSEKEEYMMRRSMTEWERYTCLKFRPATSSDRNSLRFQNGVGCNSQLGMVGGVQVLNLQSPGCRYKGLYLHEIGHAIGLVHEHQLPDRDKYISILYQNVAPHMRLWFNKYASNEVNQMTVAYEYSSVMHYGITAFSYDGQKQTIRAHDKSKEEQIGKVYLKELAFSDVQIVNMIYNCSGHCANQDQCGPDGYLDQNCNCLCRDGSSDCGSSKKSKDETCVNNYNSWACYIWANQGECERNPFYMRQQCAKACDVCDGSGADQADQTSDNDFILWPWQWFPMFANMLPKQPVLKGGCKDIYQQTKCQTWKERGDCVTNERWMKIHCRSTCNLCGDVNARPEVDCKNEYEDSTKCDDWAKDGECSVNARWMQAKCRRSCGMCDQADVNTDDENGENDEDNMKCENTNPSCEAWARIGECISNPSWMIANCRQACKKCDDGTCKNFYDDVQCQIWAQKFECVANSEWMSRQCAKSCGRGFCEGVDRESTTTSYVTGSKLTTILPTVTSGTCRNIHGSDTQCDIWASNDHCNINPAWMRKNCARSCQSCGTGSTKTDKSTGVNIGSGKPCEDLDAGCADWAKHGFCDSNPRYNLIFCKKSCNNCNGCRDAEFLCAVWAKDGHCDKNDRYMLRHCQKSCKACYMYDKS